MSEALAPSADTKIQPRGGLVTYLLVDGALKAAAFYQRAFDAQVLAAYPPDDQGRTMHVHLEINGSSLMLSDAYPEHGVPMVPAQGYTLTLMVDSADAWAERAVNAGCEIKMPVQDMFWGDRYGQLVDPFGVTWAVNQPLG